MLATPTRTSRPAATSRRRRIARMLPKDVARLVVRIRHGWRTAGSAAGWRSKLRIAWMGVETLLPERMRPEAGSAVGVRVTALNGAEIFLRPRSRDRQAFELVFQDGLHLPPTELAGPPARIAVFGANIGLPMAELAARYPEARLLGVEPDPDNAVLARTNLTTTADRCQLVEAAVWHRDAELTVSWTQDAWGFDLAEGADPGAPTFGIRAVAADRLLSDFAGAEPIDYLLVNIESAWHELLEHGEWTRSVRCIKVEIQDHYDDAVAMLERLGFHARLERLTWGAFVIGIRAGDTTPVGAEAA